MSGGGGGRGIEVDLTRISIIFKLLMFLLSRRHWNNDWRRLDSSFCRWSAPGLSRWRSCVEELHECVGGFGNHLSDCGALEISFGCGRTEWILSGRDKLITQNYNHHNDKQSIIIIIIIIIINKW